MANQIVICSYRVKPESEPEFLALLTRHWPALHDLGFVTGAPSVIYRELDERPTYVEIFTWAEGGYEQAREHRPSSRSGRRWILCSKNGTAARSGSSRTTSA